MDILSYNAIHACKLWLLGIDLYRQEYEHASFLEYGVIFCLKRSQINMMTWVSVVWRKIKIALFYQTSPSQNSKSFCGDTLKARRKTLERLSLRWYFHTSPHFQLSRRVAALLWSSYLLENTMVIMKVGWIFSLSVYAGAYEPHDVYMAICCCI